MRRAGTFALPAELRTQDGNIRRVGFELEFAGLEFQEAVETVSHVFGVKADTHTHAEAAVEHPELGRFVIEVDSKLAKELAAARARGRDNGPGEDSLAKWLINLTTELVPIEVVCPPIAMDELPQLNSLVSSLRESGAEGTTESVLYAFGVHINTELPDLQPESIGRYLKAFCIAQDWLVRRHRVDAMRRFTPYIDLYPGGYRKRVLNYDENLDYDTLLEDYFQFNATRNRSLDMLPAFKHLNANRVNAAIDDKRIKARPAFHYRLPNCEIERGDWRLSESWNLWCVVETLAGDRKLLADLAQQSLRFESNLINLTRPPWHKVLDGLLDDLVSA